MRQHNGGGLTVAAFADGLKNKYAIRDGKQTYLNHIVFSGSNLIKPKEFSDGQVNYEHLFRVLKSTADRCKWRGKKQGVTFRKSSLLQCFRAFK